MNFDSSTQLSKIINENLKKIKEYEDSYKGKNKYKLKIKYRFSFKIKKSSRKIFFRVKRKASSTFKKY